MATLGMGHVNAQTGAAAATPATLSVNGYVDAYYRHDANNTRPGAASYFYASARRNAISVNLASVDMKFNSERLRGRFAPAVGSFMEDNYAGEPQGFRNILEASAGVRLLRNKPIWLDAGVLNSPYGYEGAISRDQLSYTRSFSAENTPYFVTGAKLSADLSAKVSAAAFLLNGWQIIQETNAAKSVGAQVQVKPGGNWLLNWSAYFGNEQSLDSLQASYRAFSNLYAYWTPTKRLQVLALFDIGTQERGDAQQLWHTANLLGRLLLGKVLFVCARGEYYTDPGSIMVYSANPAVAGFNTYGGSLGLDWQVAPSALLRLEGRYHWAPHAVFQTRSGGFSESSLFFTASLAAAF